MGLPLKSQVTAQVIFRSPHVTVIVACPSPTAVIWASTSVWS